MDNGLLMAPTAIQPVHGLVGGLGEKGVAGLHLPAANVLLAAAVLLKRLGRVCLMVEVKQTRNYHSQNQSIGDLVLKLSSPRDQGRFPHWGRGSPFAP